MVCWPRAGCLALASSSTFWRNLLLCPCLPTAVVQKIIEDPLFVFLIFSMCYLLLLFSHCRFCLCCLVVFTANQIDFLFRMGTFVRRLFLLGGRFREGGFETCDWCIFTRLKKTLARLANRLRESIFATCGG